MPLSLVLILVGIVLICAAYYLPAPPPIHSLLMFAGVAAVCIGLVILIYALLVGAAGLHMALSAIPLADAYWERAYW